MHLQTIQVSVEVISIFDVAWYTHSQLTVYLVWDVHHILHL